MRFFLDGHSRIYVDSDSECTKDHAKDPPLYHVHSRAEGRFKPVVTVRCPKSLSEQERSRLKEK